MITIKERTDNKVVYLVPSASEKGLTYRVNKLTTISNTIVYTCDCIGYTTRRKANPFFECRHIREVKQANETLENNKTNNRIHL